MEIFTPVIWRGLVVERVASQYQPVSAFFFQAGIELVFAHVLNGTGATFHFFNQFFCKKCLVARYLQVLHHGCQVFGNGFVVFSLFQRAFRQAFAGGSRRDLAGNIPITFHDVLDNHVGNVVIKHAVVLVETANIAAAIALLVIHRRFDGRV